MTDRTGTGEWRDYDGLTATSTTATSRVANSTRPSAMKPTAPGGPIARVLIDFELAGTGWWMIHPLSEWLSHDASDDARTLAKEFFRFLAREVESAMGPELLADLVQWNDHGVHLYSAATEYPDDRFPVGEGIAPLDERRHDFATFWTHGDSLARRVRDRLASEIAVWMISPDVAYRRIDS